jgi:hypothetical protein
MKRKHYSNESRFASYLLERRAIDLTCNYLSATPHGRFTDPENAWMLDRSRTVHGSLYQALCMSEDPEAFRLVYGKSE